MPKDIRVINLTHGMRLRLNQARKAVENCTVAWVEYGISVRNMTLAESIAARNEQAKNREPLPYAEVHGLRFEAPERSTAANRQSRLLAYEASLLVEDLMMAAG